MALGIAARVVIVTFVFTLLTFALGLLVGIVSLALVNAFGGNVGMAGAYRHFAFPAGVFGMVVAFAGMVVTEIREARRRAESAP